MSAVIASDTRSSTATHLKGQWLWLGRLLWTTLSLLTFVLFIFAIPVRFETLNTVCNADCEAIQISEAGLRTLEAKLGLSLNTYAVIIIGKEILMGLIYMISGAVIFWRRSDDWLVIFISLTLTIFGSSAIFLVNNQFVNFLSGLGFALIIILFFLFPDGSFVPRWSRWLAVILALPLLFAPLTPFFGTAFWSAWLLFVGTVGFASQVYRYRYLATPTQRQQTKWILLGFGMIFATAFFLAVPLVLFPALSPSSEPTLTMADFIYRAIYGFFFLFIPLYCLPITIAFSTLRYRLWDADPIINRSLVYGFMTLFAITLLFAITYLIQFIFGEQQPLVAILIAALICGLTFNSARKRIQHWVDHHIYGLRFDMNDLYAAHHSVEIKNPGALTGQVIDGYEIRGVIGKGGMGEVYRGFGQGQQVAIKTMLPEIARDDAMRKRFEREAEAGQALNHRNIARVFAKGTLEDIPYLIMEYVEGTGLDTLLKHTQMLDTETTCRIFQDICSALDVAHQQGYVHRDIKPSNIMIRENGEAVLMDFGITKLQDTTSILTGTGVIGTIDYMAPEQIMAAKEVDHRADIYALGVMLYELLTGEKPFSGGPAQVMFAHLQQPVPNAREVNGTIPSELAEVIEDAMAKDPKNRFSSAGEFARALTF
jgi:tRNA A-37 threonylcarbamoyl transferase component Bud32